MQRGWQQTSLFEEEDDAIADAARAAGAEVPFQRSPATADDHSTLLDVLAGFIVTIIASRKDFDFGGA